MWKRGSWKSKILVWSGHTHGYGRCVDVHSQQRLLDIGSNHILLLGTNYYQYSGARREEIQIDKIYLNTKTIRDSLKPSKVPQTRTWRQTRNYMRWILFEFWFVWHTPPDIESCAITDWDKPFIQDLPTSLRGTENDNFCPRTCIEYGELYRFHNQQRQLDNWIQAKLLFSGTLLTKFDA